MLVFSFFLGGDVCVVGLFWRRWASILDDFRVIWGAKMKLKSILRHLVGPLAPPRGFLRAQGWHFGVILGFRIMWGAKLKLKSVLRHLVGPMAPPGDPLRAQGRHFGRFGDHFESILEAKIKPKSTPNNLCFSNIDFVRFLCVSGCSFASLVGVFWGLQRRIVKLLDM